uniref:Uncharacterized protein n=1 Tax=Cacopsylla melanoneura TaxID=428564 RepID=A0A8D9AK30_9HEMI
MLNSSVWVTYLYAYPRLVLSNAHSCTRSLPSLRLQDQTSSGSLGENEELVTIHCLPPPMITLMFLPGSSSTICLAISLQWCVARGGILSSHSHFLLATCAYSALGVACVTRVVVTKPVCLPAFCAHVMIESTLLSSDRDASQSSALTLASTPAV